MNATAVRSSWVGRVIDGRFTLLEWLGGTGRSSVFLTELPGDHVQKAAIKFIPADDEGEVRVADWAAAADLSHPHLIRPFHIGRCKIDGKAFVYAVMEYADEVLAEILPVRALTPNETKEMLGPVLDALSYLHGEGFVHGRVKPTNILVVGDNLKLSADCIHAIGEPEKYPAALSIYDAPERSTGTVFPASDIWSLGVTLVEALTQRAPDWNRSATTAPAIPESLPQPYFGIARRCLQLDPSLRCTTNDIKALIGLAQAQPQPAAQVEEKTASKPSMLVIIAVAVVLVVTIALFWMRSHQPQSSSSVDQQQTQVPAPAQPQTAKQQPPDNAPQAQPQSQAPTPSSAQDQAPASAPAQTSVPSTPAPVTATPAGNGAAAKGAVAQRAQPDVLASASRSIHGTVNVRVRVNVGPDGNISNATFDSAGPSRYFAKVAMQAAQQWKFKPAQVNGQPVASEWLLHFQFTRDASDVTPVETTP